MCDIYLEIYINTNNLLKIMNRFIIVLVRSFSSLIIKYFPFEFLKVTVIMFGAAPCLKCYFSNEHSLLYLLSKTINMTDCSNLDLIMAFTMKIIKIFK